MGSSAELYAHLYTHYMYVTSLLEIIATYTINHPASSLTKQFLHQLRHIVGIYPKFSCISNTFTLVIGQAIVHPPLSGSCGSRLYLIRFRKGGPLGFVGLLSFEWSSKVIIGQRLYSGGEDPSLP